MNQRVPSRTQSTDSPSIRQTLTAALDFESIRNVVLSHIVAMDIVEMRSSYKPIAELRAIV